MIPSLAGIIVFYTSLIAYSEYQAKNAYDRFYSSSSRSLAFANKLLSTSLGFSSDKLSVVQAKKAKDLLRLIALRGNVQCLAIQGEFYSLYYPPRQYCSTENGMFTVRDKLQKSSGLYLNLYLDIDSVDSDVRQIRLLTYCGGTLLVFGALASATFYSSRKALNQQIQTDRLIDEIIASSPNPYIIVCLLYTSDAADE